MNVLDAGNNVFMVRFLPDGRRLLVGTATPERQISFEVWTLPAGGRVRLALPELRLDDWWYAGYGNAVAFDPAGERCYLAWGGSPMGFLTENGMPVAAPDTLQVPPTWATHDVPAWPEDAGGLPLPVLLGPGPLTLPVAVTPGW